MFAAADAARGPRLPLAGRVLYISAVILVLAVVHALFVWYSLLLACAWGFAALLVLPFRPWIALALLGSGLTAPWSLALTVSSAPLFLASLFGFVLIAGGLWYGLPGRWVCPLCRKANLRLFAEASGTCEVCKNGALPSANTPS